MLLNNFFNLFLIVPNSALVAVWYRTIKIAYWPWPAMSRCCDFLWYFCPCRIPNAGSLFDYEGDKILEEKVFEDCKLGKICHCEGTQAICGREAIKACFPSENELTNQKPHENVDGGK